MPTVSIIICTRDNADSLALTLAAIAGVAIPADLPTELLVVDNGSRDHTRRVVDEIRLDAVPVRYIHEPHPGKGFAYNAGLDQARGDVFLFTDDDTRPPANWVDGMCRAVAENEVDAVAGGVVIPPHLHRPWMTAMHRTWLASTELITDQRSWRLVGANMAFSRTVLEKIPAFDVELGPGALGFEDETLLSRQIIQAGLRVGTAFDVAVQHWFKPDRLTRSSFRSMAEKMGRSQAYVEHHWIHYDRNFPRLRWLKHLAQVQALRWTAGGGESDGIGPAEMELRVQTALYARTILEHRRPRNYAERGLERLVKPDPADGEICRPLATAECNS